jgi:hypothetical protein
MEVNRADTLAEVAEVFAAYERALGSGDVDALTAAFWATGEVVRFGIADHQVGDTELRQWRAAQPPLPPGRALVDTRITTFATDFAVVTTRFTYPDGENEGRQSQTWVRLAEGWRIVSAHVSYPEPLPVSVRSGR